METPISTQEFHATFAHLITDREQLRIALTYAESAISELETQNRELDVLLSKTQAALTIASELPGSKIASQTSWIGGTWLSCPTATPFLTPVESAWQQGQAQKALASLTLILSQQDITHSQRIDAELLFSAILRSSGDIRQALVHAEKSLSLAEKTQRYDLVGKAQFHRGLCHLYDNRYANARWCFVLASHTPGHEELVAINLKMTEQRLLELPPDDSRRSLSMIEQRLFELQPDDSRPSLSLRIL